MTIKRPRSVTVISCLFAAVGVIGFAYHATEFSRQGAFQYEVAWVLVLRVLASVSGVFMLRGANWARWLALAWLAYHVVLSMFHSWPETVMHGALLAGVAYVLFRPEASAFFRGANRSPLDERPS